MPGFEGYYDEVLGYVLANFLPGTGLEVSDQFGLLLENARKVTGFGILALVVTALPWDTLLARSPASLANLASTRQSDPSGARLL